MQNLLLLLLLNLVQCNHDKAKMVSADVIIKNNIRKSEKLTQPDLKVWYTKDIVSDTISGISLEKAYQKLGNKKLNDVIVAIIDTEIDIHHEDLKNNIWTNTNEIPGNKIDDDRNGYTDDVHGWNFIGNERGENIIYSNTASVRVIRFYEGKFGKLKNPDQLSAIEKKSYQEYLRAKSSYDTLYQRALEDKEYGDFLVNTYPKSKEILKHYFPKEDYTINQLDSLYSVYQTNDSLARLIYYMADYIKYDLTQEFIYKYQEEATCKLLKTYNSNYNDRQILGDNPHNINDINYGNNLVAGNLDKMFHGTGIGGIIGAERNNGIGINGIAKKIKIMSLAISSNGSEHDKDIALAIRYSVNNGAKIINMSFGKTFSLHKNWVLDAIKYAAEKDVLIVKSSGNSSYNLNRNNSYYPNDNLSNKKEVSDNFIMVGSTSHSLDENFRSWFSNYGKIDVDIFAPGEQIYTTRTHNRYQYDSGTSLSSAITTGVAALLWSYEPTLSAKEVKNILLNSGVEYDLEVKISEDESKPFGSLSKSGKVLNAYNALLLADERK